MAPLTWPGLNLHPFVPYNQAEGYLQIINELRSHLKSVTKFDEISFQPNSGASGEYAGLLTIAQYLKSNGQGHRNICLIPRSAHGTNPASAILAGMKVIPVEVSNGRVDMADFRAKAEKYKDNLGAYMITFPSTAGKYEDTIQEMADVIHKYGGQVYMDGANMNAQVGYTSPGYLGADVCHLNLHKTFAIPHGGGGPGMGPIGVKKHLIPYLPTHPYSEKPNKTALGTLTASEFGSASILTISYAYISMLGKEGVRKSTAYAILNANYLMKKLEPYFKISYMESGERCSHEFIMDISNIKKATGVGEEDIAKRLMDYGFHAPTMSFPVPGTLMVEPTESEDK
jgi:glycine dehydrogenase